MTEAQQLQADIEAQTAAFLRSGGAITKLDYAGVPIEAEYGQQVFLSTGAVPAPAKPAYGRLSAPTVEAPPPKALPVVKPSPAPARFETVADWCERVAAKPRSIIPELRAIRADARTWLARLDRSFPLKT